MCHVVSTDAAVAAYVDKLHTLRAAEDPDFLTECDPEHAALKGDLTEDDLAEYGLRPVDIVDPADELVLELSAAGG